MAVESHFSRVGGFLKWGYSQIIYFDTMLNYKPSILGQPHLWNPPNDLIDINYQLSTQSVVGENPAILGLRAATRKMVAATQGLQGHVDVQFELEGDRFPQVIGAFIYIHTLHIYIPTNVSNEWMNFPWLQPEVAIAPPGLQDKRRALAGPFARSLFTGRCQLSTLGYSKIK